MNASIADSQERLREKWKAIVDENGLSGQDPRQIVAACRQLSLSGNARLCGVLVQHLAARADRIVHAMYGYRQRNDSDDPVAEVVEDLIDDILDLQSADGAGFEKSFKGKLRHRLIDKIRRRNVRQNIKQPAPCDASNEPIEPPDESSLGPEDHAVIATVLGQLPEKHRLAYQLHEAGFPYSSKTGASISSMLKITPKTAEDWVDRATQRIMQLLGQQP
ncbi:RNA polymerase sigma factor [Methylobacterium phyllosphaerae]|uniref:RNA polymerase sigma factor n=1 Tax=Methylobacterium phyllosphaerae TaxID=418223 RepID=UPI001113A17D|nr:sigma-70 family RNA polymerase sigma factor [Methylobacterium phyllosphaerae]